ncbi:hypothetical protein SNEBB_002301 [Seison nebaliae]|nr:hypothetical protein SNEBB_002301 [Seison nebaliae]
MNYCCTDSEGVRQVVFNQSHHHHHSHSQHLPNYSFLGNSESFYNQNNLNNVGSSSGAYGPRAASAAGIPNYCSFNDPHLKTYHAKKFASAISSNYRTSNKLRDLVGSSHRSLSSFTMRAAHQQTIYLVSIRTHSDKDSGTYAKAYIKFFGELGKTPRKYLAKITQRRTRTSKSDRTYSRSERMIFYPGTIERFYIDSLDVGNLKSIGLEHDGNYEEDSWKVDYVKIKNLRTKEEWSFSINDWLSLYHTNGKTHGRYMVTKNVQKNKLTRYEVTCITGDVKYGGTEANVYLTLFGKKNKLRSEKFPLRKYEIGEGKQKNQKIHGTTAFRRGSTDTFMLVTKCVGQLNKIRIEHDNMGKYAGWFLDRIVIKDLNVKNGIYYFPCNQWLAKDENDGRISRDLDAFTDPTASRKNNLYRIKIFTGSKSGSGTDADVFVTLFGTNGESTEIRLDNQKNNFERNNVDEFDIETLSIGRLNRLRIGHNNKGVAPGWFLDKVEILDDTSKISYIFPCNKWFALNEDDGQLSRILLPLSDDMEINSSIPYEVSVKTGNLLNAGTSAKVWITLYGIDYESGEEINSGKIWIDASFPKGRTTNFTVDSIKIMSPITSVEIGHDNSGSGPGWYVDEVTTFTSINGFQQTFDCMKWLSVDEDDGRVERRLKENRSKRIKKQPGEPWLFRVFTGDKKNAGTDANVYLQLYGDKGKCDELKLQSYTNVFEKNTMDEFKLNTTNLVGRPYKLRVWHDNKGTSSGWYLDKIEGYNLLLKEKYVFKCQKWLATDEDDGEIVRELLAIGKTIKQNNHLQHQKYDVMVETGKQRGAGTDSNVFICLFGQNGDTGDRRLISSKTHKNKFEKGNIDHFMIEAVDLEQLKSLRIGHDNTGNAAGWFLNRIDVKCNRDKYEFLCNRWLAKDEDDGLIIRDLTTKDVAFLDKVPYRISVITGDVAKGGTDANVFLELYGKTKNSGTLPLKKSLSSKNKFERNHTDTFEFELIDLGKLEKIRIWHDGKGAGCGWYLSSVKIDVPSSGYSYLFHFDRWLASNEHDGKLEVEANPSKIIEQQKKSSYELEFHTGNKFGAGTDADVVIQIFGDRGKTQEHSLDNESDNFERGKIDKFRIEDDEVGKIQKIRLGHDGKKAGADWLLEKLIIRKHKFGENMRNSRRSNIESESDVSEDDFWNNKSQRNSKTKRKDFNKSKRFSSRSSRSSRQSNDRKEMDIESYYFFISDWFSKSKGKKQLISDFYPTDEHGKSIVHQKMVQYRLNVFTEDIKNADTNSNVHCIIYGENGDTGKQELNRCEKDEKLFGRDCENIFVLDSIDLGKIQKLIIGHDNSSKKNDWYLNRVEIEEYSDKRKLGNKLIFPCAKWLSDNKGDGQISRSLLPISEQAYRKMMKQPSRQSSMALEMEAQNQKFGIFVYTSDKRSAGTSANVYLQIFGNEEISEKLILKKSLTNRKSFQRGNCDEFEINTFNLGSELKKIIIEHDGKGFGNGWHLDRIEIKSFNNNREWIFPCREWLDESEGNGELHRELYPAKVEEFNEQIMIPYEISIHTSNEKKSSTTELIECTIYNDEGQSSNTMELTTNINEEKPSYDEGEVETFVVHGKDIGNAIAKLRLAFSKKSKSGNNRWKIDRIEIRKLVEMKKGRSTSKPTQNSLIFEFLCSESFGKLSEDKQTSREFVPSSIYEEDSRTSERKCIKKFRNKNHLTNYTVCVFTGMKSGAGTNANVFMTIFGDKGDSGEFQLSESETHKDKFEKGHTDIFQYKCVDLGELYKINLRHDNKSFSADWYVDKIMIKNEESNENFTFHCEKWFSKNKGDKKISRNLYAHGLEDESLLSGSMASGINSSRGSGSRLSSSVFNSVRHSQQSNRISKDLRNRGNHQLDFIYVIKLITGSSKKAATDGKIWMILKNENKKIDSGKLWLTLDDDKEMMAGSEEIFQTKTLKIFPITSVVIGHEAISESNSWHLMNCIIDLPSLGKRYTLNCDHWFNVPANVQKEFFINEDETREREKQMEYEVTIITADEAEAGCNGNIHMKMFGPNKKNGEENIFKKAEGLFDRGSVNTITYMDIDMINPKKLRFFHDEKKGNWRILRAEVLHKKLNKIFVYDASIFDERGYELKYDEKIDLPLMVNNRPVYAFAKYEIEVTTSDHMYSGTDANVYIVLFGDDSQSIPIHLKKSETNKNPFEKGHSDIFIVNNVLQVGEIERIRIWHDNTKLSSSWHLQSVRIKQIQPKKRQYEFECNEWLSDSKGDKQLCREFFHKNFDAQKSHRPDTGRKNENGEIECHITTGDYPANDYVILQFFDEKRKELSKKLLIPAGTFEKNSTKVITQNSAHFRNRIGAIGVALKEDNPTDRYSSRGSRSGRSSVRFENGMSSRKGIWSLETIDIIDKNLDVQYHIDVHETIQDKQMKLFRVSEKKKLSRIDDHELIQYEVQVFTGGERDAGTDANIKLTLFGKNGDSGKQPLSHSLEHRNKFERNNRDVFLLECANLGDLTKIFVESDGAGFSASWLLDYVDVINKKNGETTTFPCKQRLDKHSGLTRTIYRN